MKLIRMLLELGPRDDYLAIRKELASKRKAENQAELESLDSLIEHFEDLCKTGLNCTLYKSTLVNLKKDRVRLAADLEQDSQ